MELKQHQRSIHRGRLTTNGSRSSWFSWNRILQPQIERYLVGLGFLTRYSANLMFSLFQPVKRAREREISKEAGVSLGNLRRQQEARRHDGSPHETAQVLVPSLEAGCLFFVSSL